jgi:hypothetical protein
VSVGSDFNPDRRISSVVLSIVSFRRIPHRLFLTMPLKFLAVFRLHGGCC